jgi:hypothetical protein
MVENEPLALRCHGTTYFARDRSVAPEDLRAAVVTVARVSSIEQFEITTGPSGRPRIEEWIVALRDVASSNDPLSATLPP